jgi:hypothetical protein
MVERELVERLISGRQNPTQNSEHQGIPGVSRGGLLSFLFIALLLRYPALCGLASLWFYIQTTGQIQVCPE